MLRVHPLFSSSAVLQRDKPLCVWGNGEEGGRVAVFLQGQERETIVRDGGWSVEFGPLHASNEEKLEIASETERLTVEHIAVGEVWIAGGQSNMEFPMRNLKEYPGLKRTREPMIRLFGVPKVSYEGHLQDDDFSNYGFWRQCTPENLWFYPAAPFYFAMRLHEHFQVPIGILNCNFGGTRASTWADPAILKTTAARVWTDEYENSAAGLDMDAYAKAFRSIRMFRTHAEDYAYLNNKNWRGFSRFELFFWKRLYRFFIPALPPLGPMDRNRPGALFEHMVKTIAPYAARGVIWYQGESDDPHADVYDEAMGAVIDSWRRLWREELPFLMVELAPYEGFGMFSAVNYVAIRERQEKLARSLPGVFVTNVMDAGSRMDIHPKAKRVVGERLAMLACGKVYGEDVLCLAPALISGTMEAGEVRLAFDSCGAGLRRGKNDVDALCVEADGRPAALEALEVRRDCLILKSGSFRNAASVCVRYGKRNYCECNIKNSAGIPIAPFECSFGGTPGAGAAQAAILFEK